LLKFKQNKLIIEVLEKFDRSIIPFDMIVGGHVPDQQDHIFVINRCNRLKIYEKAEMKNFEQYVQERENKLGNIIPLYDSRNLYFKITDFQESAGFFSGYSYNGYNIDYNINLPDGKTISIYKIKSNGTYKHRTLVLPVDIMQNRELCYYYLLDYLKIKNLCDIITSYVFNGC